MPGDYPRKAGWTIVSSRWPFTGIRGTGNAVVAGYGVARRLIGARQRAVSSPTRLVAWTATATLAGSAVAVAAETAPGLSVGTVEVIQLAMFVGVMGAALLLTVFLIRERARTANENIDLRGRVADLSSALQRSEALLNLRDQRVIAWTKDGKKLEVVGSLPTEAGAPDERATFLAFGKWLTPRSASAVDHAVAALRDNGTHFDLVAETHTGAPLEVQGRKTVSHLIVRFVSLSEAQRVQARLRLENQRLAADHDNMAGLLDTLPMPAWTRAADGRLRWVNKAYADAVEAGDAAGAVRDGREFLGTQTREDIARQHETSPVYSHMVSTVIAGDRRKFDVTDFANGDGSAGLAVDVSAVDAVREEYERTVRNHADTLDQLTTAVAIFDAQEKLRFFNQAFQKLWDLDVAFLESAPDNTLLLDRLRTEGKIPEQPEWRRWKAGLLAAYRSVDSQVHWWHLPDGRTLRVVANPQPKGGVTWVFENLTEKIDLESRYATAVRVQGETLDNLAEGVAVFGPDGRIRLSNPAFSRLWNIDPAFAQQNTHIATIKLQCDPMAEDSPWASYVALVTGFDEEREDRRGQVELKNGTVLRYALIHLPNGQVMMTFVDVTDSVNVERALKDKNDALQRADQLKNEFVQHVSYELRSPLTNIIGFTELLSLPATGPLTLRQREYVEHIGSSSSVLLTIVNDILDLATVDAGIMELDFSDVRIEQTIVSAAELVADRLEEHAINLKIDMAHAPKTIRGDETRIRQILYNLLSNAVNYAPGQSVVTLSCLPVPGGVEFAVHDDGPGMPDEILEAVFQRFEARSNGGRRRGAGLGLAIVKSFVELHAGTVRIDTGQGKGTTVTCFFPFTPGGFQIAAE